MREIKFRAWETKEKRMLQAGSFNIFNYHNGDYGISHHFHDETVRQYRFNKCARNGWDETKPEVILMQYTGLKDKNGKEIYEGDIIIAPFEDLEENKIVHFKRGSFKVGQYYLCIFAEEDCQIIGNKYENPELLKGKEE